VSDLPPLHDLIYLVHLLISSDWQRREVAPGRSMGGYTISK
jgi:hypothetical protein